ncbi:MAG TPA: PKD domain-containing protein [Chitinophagales bacterium]|nr:T9SS type A sorting domain-containing protein [Chitinophagales bacterium]HMX03216.1 PKD domain-containing protein [Chitinophagales bacterium]HMZ87785.1 PKD domain-containing protein [Chitinophagales bacterium]HNA57004.1 PKD domain-containing protein [Chitinophagales bacterium]HNE45301.1 PKD domain-containing protein [Chitinophagales bacterium]
MRKLLLTVAAGVISVSLFAQTAVTAKPHNKAEMMAKFKNAKAVPYQPQVNADLNGTPLNTNTFYAKSGARTGESIGITGYPLMSNSASYDRVRVYDDGAISAIWTGSTVADGSWADRGSFYNHNDGASWGPAPTARVETVRTGFPELLTVMDHEVVIAHDGTNQRLFANASIGGTTWTELPTSGMHHGLWPRAYCPAGTDDIYLVSPNASPVVTINFSRSDDGGATWTVLNDVLPLDSTNCFGALSADAYQIAVDGSNVYILYGTSWTDLVLLTSTSNGDPGSWTITTIINTGFCNYQGDLDQTSDVTGDGIADTVETTDGFHEMVLDDAGVVHVWSGYYWLLDDDPATEGWSYFPSLYGLWYWNSTMAAESPMWIDLLVDWDDSGDAFDGIGADLGMYDGVTFTSMPTAAIDEDAGRIYLAYTMPIEYTDYFDDPTVAEAQSFRDLFGVYSDDMGLSWSAPVNMTYTAHDNQEVSFPYAFDRFLNGCMYTIWHQDDEPGTALDVGQVAADVNSIANMQFRCFDEARFNPYPPTAEYDYTPDGTTGLVNFTNLSVDADTYSWDFGDGGSSTAKNPAHVYATSGVFNVCLTAMNKYDDDNACKVIDITVGVVDYALGQALSVYPTPASTNVTVEVNGNFGTLYAEVYNALGERVINTTAFNGSVNFDVTALSAGNYIVKVATVDGKYTSRQISVSK